MTRDFLMHSLLDQYEASMETARARFDRDNALSGILRPETDPILLELFLIHFNALGVQMTDPVEGWIRRAGERCEEFGLPELGKALKSHSKAEAGHQLMMVRDTRRLVDRWNRRHATKLDAEKLMATPATRGIQRYCRVHEDNIAGRTPYAQIAIEYEIEMLPLKYGSVFIKGCLERLGADIADCMEFVNEHVTLDIGHSKFNGEQLRTFIERKPESLPALIAAGTEALDAYAEFLGNCELLAGTRLKTLAAAEV
jgi:hypothetical protein